MRVVRIAFLAGRRVWVLYSTFAPPRLLVRLRHASFYLEDWRTARPLGSCGEMIKSVQRYKYSSTQLGYCIMQERIYLKLFKSVIWNGDPELFFSSHGIFFFLFVFSDSITVPPRAGRK